MKRLFVTALLASAAIAHAQTAASAAPASTSKKELVQKLLVLQQPAIEGMARDVIEQPAARLMQAAGQVLQQQVPPEKREAVGRAVEADVKKYVDETFPIARDRAIKLAPSTIGATMEEKFTEDELKQLIAWLESPVSKKYQQLGLEMRSNFTQKLVADARPAIEPRLQALQTKVGADLGLPPPGGAPAAPASAPKAAAAPKKAASK